MVATNRFRTSLCALAVLLLAAPSVQAREKNGLALGVESGLTNTGLSIKYAIGNFHIQLIEGLDLFAADEDPDVSGIDFVWASTLRFTYNIARMMEETNLWLGVGATFDVFDAIDDDEDLDVRVTLELLLGVEHFFSEFFSVGGFMGIPFRLSQTRQFQVKQGDETVTKSVTGVGVSISGVSWGATFHFYF